MKVSLLGWSVWRAGDDRKSKPPLDFLPSRARRRLSQLSRMILEVGHEALVGHDVDDVVFASRYGEIGRQLEITEGILEEGEVSPSAFSHSVFNTPVALLSLFEGITGSTRALYGGEESLVAGLMQAVVHAQRNQRRRVLFLYGDESIPEAYLPLVPEDIDPLAIGLILGPFEGEGRTIEVCVGAETEASSRDVGDLASWLESDGSQSLILNTTGYRVSMEGDQT